MAQGHPRSLILAQIEKHIQDFLLVFNSNLGPILPRFTKSHRFPYPTHISDKFLGCSLWSRTMMLVSANSEHPWLTRREIIFELFQPI